MSRRTGNGNRGKSQSVLLSSNVQELLSDLRKIKDVSLNSRILKLQHSIKDNNNFLLEAKKIFDKYESDIFYKASLNLCGVSIGAFLLIIAMTKLSAQEFNQIDRLIFLEIIFYFFGGCIFTSFNVFNYLGNQKKILAVQSLINNREFEKKPATILTKPLINPLIKKMIDGDKRRKDQKKSSRSCVDLTYLFLNLFTSWGSRPLVSQESKIESKEVLTEDELCQEIKLSVPKKIIKSPKKSMPPTTASRVHKKKSSAAVLTPSLFYQQPVQEHDQNILKKIEVVEPVEVNSKIDILINNTDLSSSLEVKNIDEMKIISAQDEKIHVLESRKKYLERKIKEIIIMNYNTMIKLKNELLYWRHAFFQMEQSTKILQTDNAHLRNLVCSQQSQIKVLETNQPRLVYYTHEIPHVDYTSSFPPSLPLNQFFPQSHRRLDQKPNDKVDCGMVSNCA